MTQEEKELLLKDLCARLPHETRVRYFFEFAGAVGITGYSDEGTLSYDKLQNFSQPNVGYETRRVVNIVPYLRPMSSMTEKEKKEFEDLGWRVDELENNEAWAFNHSINSIVKGVDWLIAHYFDFRGLIPMNLALEAKEGMYKNI